MVRRDLTLLLLLLAVMVVPLACKPSPTPTPPKPPEPPPPVMTGLRVLFVYETEAKLTREQLNTLHSTAIAGYLNAKCSKDSKGRSDWRRWDDDVDTSKESDVWKGLWLIIKPKLVTLPAVVVVTDQKTEVFPLPATEAETLALLKKVGGD